MTFCSGSLWRPSMLERLRHENLPEHADQHRRITYRPCCRVSSRSPLHRVGFSQFPAVTMLPHFKKITCIVICIPQMFVLKDGLTLKKKTLHLFLWVFCFHALLYILEYISSIISRFQWGKKTYERLWRGLPSVCCCVESIQTMSPWHKDN